MKTITHPFHRHSWRHFGCALLVSMVAFAFTPASAELQSEIKPGQVWNDVDGQRINAHGGCVIFHQGLYYWYGTHKIEGLSEETHADGGFRCYSSTDLINWKNEGMMLSLDRPEDEDLTHECNADRPKVIYNETTQEFVMLFKLYLRGQGTDVAYTAVATSQSPTGPFDYRHKFLGAHSPNGTGDFALFKDDDGSLYHFSVRKPDKSFVIGKMSDDYLYPEGDYNVAEGVTEHTEGPAVFKHKGKYFILGSASTGWNPNPARQFSAEAILGPWTAAQNPVSGTNPHNGLGPDKTFGGQSNFILKVEGKEDAYIAMFDINKPEHPYESGYIWLPITLNGNEMSIPWRDAWTLDVFNPAQMITNPGFESLPFGSGWDNTGLATLSTGGLAAGSTQAALLGGIGELRQDIPGLTDATLEFLVQPITAQGDQTFELNFSEVTGGFGSPVVVSLSSMVDTYLRESSNSDFYNRNWGNDTTDGGEMLLGGNSGGDLRPLLRFDLAGIVAPPGKQLTSVTLGLTNTRASASGVELTHIHQYGFNFVEGTGDGSTGTGNGATWNDPDGNDTDTPGGDDTTPGGTLGTLLSSTLVSDSASPLFPSSQNFIDAANAALGGTFNLILDPDRTAASTTWGAADFIGIASREKGINPPTLKLIFDSLTGVTPIVRLRGTPAGALEVYDGSSWVPVAGSSGALVTGQTTKIAITLHDLGSASRRYDLLWSDPGATTLSSSTFGLTVFSNIPSTGEVNRLAFSRSSGGEGTAIIDDLYLQSNPALSIRNGDFEDSWFLPQWTFLDVVEIASFTGSSSATAARFPYNVPSSISQEIQPADEFTFGTLFQIAGNANASLNLSLGNDAGEIIGVRIPTGGGLQVNAGAVWIDLLENGTNSPVSLLANTTYQLEIIACDLGTPAAAWDLSWFPAASPGSVESVVGLTTFASLDRATSGDGVHYVAFQQIGVAPSNSFLIDDVSLSPVAGVSPSATFHPSGLDGNDAGLLSWAAGQGIDPGAGSAAISQLDGDLDQVPGGIEYALGLSLIERDVIGDLIAVTTGPAFTYIARSDDPFLNIVPEYSTELTAPWDPFLPGNEIGVVDQSNVPQGFIRKSFTFPASARIFGRLSVEISN